MNKKRIFGYILLGFVISIFLQNIFSEKSYASVESNSQTPSFENSKTNNSYPDFVSAADKADKAPPFDCIICKLPISFALQRSFRALR